MKNGESDFILFHLDEAWMFWHRWKWGLLLSVTLPVIVVLFILLNSGLGKKELLTLKSLSLDIKADEILVNPMQRDEYEKILFFLDDEILWQSYLQELSISSENKLWGKKPTAMFSEVFSFQLTPEKLKKEMLEYLTLESAYLSAEDLSIVNGFFKNVFSSYYLKELLKDYQLRFLQKTYQLLASRRELLLQKEQIDKKLSNLSTQKRIPPSDKERYQLMLQLDSQNERYLEIGQQVVANEILQNDYKENLGINERELALMSELLGIAKDLETKYFKSFCWEIERPFQELRKLKETAHTKNLEQEISKLETVFELVRTNFRSNSFFSSKKAPEYYLKLALLYVILVSFGFFIILFAEIQRRKKYPTKKNG